MIIKDKYLKDGLSTEELEVATKELLEAKFDQENRHRFRQALADRHGIKRPVPGRRRRLYGLLAIAAGILMFIFSITLLREPSSALDLTEDYLALHFANDERRKAGDDLDELRAAAIDAYQRKDFAEAARLREGIVLDDAAGEDDLFFIGLSYLYQQPSDAAAAVTYLQKVLALPSPERVEETQWFLALAYLLNGQDGQARELLQTIQEQQQWNKDLARKLLDVLAQH